MIVLTDTIPADSKPVGNIVSGSFSYGVVCNMDGALTKYISLCLHA